MRLFVPFIVVVASLISSASFALEQPKGRVILTVTGAIMATNLEQSAVFDQAMLQVLPTHSITTRNPWTKGLHMYQGFSAVDLLTKLGNKGTLLKVTALNQYMTEIPLSDFVVNGAIFATHQDGKPMSVRKLGPIMVIYPFDQRDDLKSEVFYGRSIWQVDRIESIVLTE